MTRSHRATPLPADSHDTGSIQILLLGFTALALSVVTVVVAATSLYLEHTRLFALADATALASAESFTTADVVVVGDRVVAQLSPESVLSAATDYLRRSSAHTRFEHLGLVAARSPDGRSAEVTLTSRWRPPWIGGVLPVSLPVAVTSRARVILE